MSILQENAIEDYKAHTELMIAYARYKIGSDYQQVAIHRKERLKDGRVAAGWQRCNG